MINKVFLVFSFIILFLFYFTLFYSIPEIHSSIIKDNILLKRTQSRINYNYKKNSNIDINIQESLESCIYQLDNQKDIINGLNNKLLNDENMQSEKIYYNYQNNQKNNDYYINMNNNRNNLPLPILILCHNRPDYLEKTLDNILANRPSSEQFPIIVSQDGNDKRVWELINGPKYYNKVIGIQFLERGILKNSYYYIAQHFKFAISSVLDKLQFSDVIILEDDMYIGSDFFKYFLRMRDELYNDDSLYVASAWNDNGQNDHGRDPSSLKRSDFFPGLGWIMTGKLWNELGPKWPEGYWDDWMREPEQRKGRHCIYPEISRSWTFGEQGSSSGQFWKEYLEPVRLYTEEPIEFKDLDLSYLNNDIWFESIRQRLLSATEINLTKLSSQPPNNPVIIVYKSDSDYVRIAKQFNIMYDEKAGIHRTAYKGVVYFWYNDREIYLVNSNYKQEFDI